MSAPKDAADAVWRRCHDGATERAREGIRTWKNLQRWYRDGAPPERLRIESGTGLVVLDAVVFGESSADETPIAPRAFTRAFAAELVEVSGDVLLSGLLHDARALDAPPVPVRPSTAADSWTSVEELKAQVHAQTVANIRARIEAGAWAEAEAEDENLDPKRRVRRGPVARALQRRDAWLRVWSHLAGVKVPNGEGLMERPACIAGALIDRDGRRRQSFLIGLTLEDARARRRRTPPPPLNVPRLRLANRPDLARRLGYDLGGRFDQRRRLSDVLRRFARKVSLPTAEDEKAVVRGEKRHPDKEVEQALQSIRDELRRSLEKRFGTDRDSIDKRMHWLLADEEDYFAAVCRLAPEGIISMTGWGPPDAALPVGQHRIPLDRDGVRAVRQVRRQLADAERGAWSFILQGERERGQRMQLDRYSRQLVAWLIVNGWQALSPAPPGMRARLFAACVPPGTDRSAALRDDARAAQRLVAGWRLRGDSHHTEK